MRNLGIGNLGKLIGFVAGLGLAAGSAYAAEKRLMEDYVKSPLPPGFQVVVTELEGPVFADSKGKTLYKWPIKSIRNGDVGEHEPEILAPAKTAWDPPRLRGCELARS